MTPPAGMLRGEVSGPARGRRDPTLYDRLRARAKPAGDRWTCLTVPAPAIAPERLIEVLPWPAHVLWSPPGEPASVGLGVAHEIRAAGPGRMVQVREAARRLFVRAADPPLDGPPPRLFGGFAFAPGQAQAPPWASFGDARFIMPRWVYRVGGDSASLSLVWDATAERDHERLRYEAFEIERALQERRSDIEPRRLNLFPQVERLSFDLWREQVDAIRDAIDAGQFHKVVAARSTTVRCGAPVRIGPLLRRLSAAHPQCIRYSFSWSGKETLVGATPERLVRLRGREVVTDALAGSIPIGDAEGLLASAKDAHEHRLVVETIVKILRPYLSEVEHPESPRLRRLRDVAHMETPIRGRLAREAHVLDLVGALHPTPAVGGVPQRGAQDWIVAHEQRPRGWYSGPIGWFDASGDGDFGVALRCGVLSRGEAHIFAGAGIVRGSEPQAEYQETRLKMRALVGALGAEEEA